MTPEIPECFYRVGIKALILDQDKKKFLIALKSNGKWSLLGGGINWGESVEECMTRELQEEAGFEIVSLNPHPAYIISGQRDDGTWVMDIIHEVVVKDLHFIPSDECVEIKFVTANEVKDLRTNKALLHLAQVFDATLHNRFRKKTPDLS